MCHRILVSVPVFQLLFSSLGLTQTASMRVSLPSPTAATLGKFGDIPVSLYSGLPDISIPLFTAKGKTLELPIVLKYHAGGIRVEEIGGWVGIGWTLEAGGAITRTVHGLRDESNQGYYNQGHTWYSSWWPNPSITILNNVRDGTLDNEPDQFFFSFAGRSGQFVMGPTSSSPTLKEIRPIPYQKLRFAASNPAGPFEITAEDGTKYTFGSIETTADQNITSGGEDSPEYGIPVPSSWQLTEIRSIGGDVISLYYTQYTARHRLGTQYESFQHTGGQCPMSEFWVTTEHVVQPMRLDSIKAAQHTIHFTAGLYRTDALSPPPFNAPQEPFLDSVTVTTPSGTVLRVFKFGYDYSTGRLTLRSLAERDRTGASLPPYSFEYDPQVLPSYASLAQDHWGFYNGKSNMPPALPPEADRRPDFVFGRAGLLTKITYPTGGFSHLYYEPNDYGGIALGGGMPMGEGDLETATLSWQWPMYTQSTPFVIGGEQPVIAKLTLTMQPSNCDPSASDGCAITEIVGPGGLVGTWSAPGTHFVTLAPASYTLRLLDNQASGSASNLLEWREIIQLPKKTGGGVRVARIDAADGMGAGATTMIRKYVYTLQSEPARSSGIVNTEPDYDHTYTSSSCSYISRSSMSKMPLGSGSSGQVGYREVTVWYGLNAEFGKTRHTFRSVTEAADDPPYFPNSWPHARRTVLDWKRGQELETTEYSATNQMQRRVTATHAFRDEGTPEPETTRRFRGMAVHPFSSGALPWGSNYYYNPFEVISAWAYQDSETTTAFDTTGTSSFSSSKVYVYGNPNHVQLTEVRETNSDNTQRITRMKYPADYATAASGDEGLALNAMRTTAHIHNAVIERWVVEKIGTTERIVEAQLTTFKLYAAGQYLPYQRFVLNSPSPVQ